MALGHDAVIRHPHAKGPAAAGPFAAGGTGRRAAVSLLWLLVLLGIAALVLVPLLQLQGEAFAEAGSTWEQVWRITGIHQTIANTVFLGLGSVIISLVLGTSLAWWISRLPGRLRTIMWAVPMIPLVIPPAAFVVGWSFLLTPRVGYINQLLRKLPWWSGLDTGPFDIYSVPFIVMISGLLLTPFVYVFVSASLASMGGEFEAAAVVSGSSLRRAFFTITLPLLRPAIVYAAGVVLLLGLGQFTVPLLLGRPKGINVITTEMYGVRDIFPINYGLAAMLGVPLLVLGAVVVAAQRVIIGDQRRFVVRTSRGSPMTVRGRGWALLPVLVFTVLVVILPLVTLTYVALSPFWSGKLEFGDLTIRHVNNVLFVDPRTGDAIMTSVRLSALSVLIVLPLGFTAAHVIARGARVRPWLRRSIDLLVTLPLGIPAALFGFAILFAYSRPPLNALYGSDLVIVISYVTIMLPYATRTQLATLMALGDDFAEASLVSGAGPLRTLMRITLPLARKGVGAAAAILVVLLFHEFSASLMVRDPRTNLMGTVLYDYWSTGNLPAVAAMALVMVAMTIIGIAIAILIGGRRALENL